MELRYCRLSKDADIEEIFADVNTAPWQYDDALFIYIDDLPRFAEEYRALLGEGTYQNRDSGLYDEDGENCFFPGSIEPIMASIAQSRPTECEIFLEWLEKAKRYNGFYLLGL